MKNIDLEQNEAPDQEIEQTAPEAPQAQDANGLQIMDIANANKIIGAVLERGGIFSAAEIVEVSGVYARLKQFLDNLPKGEE